nr:MAG TPA: hypothetical protein [Caudoviricetes sp.]
MNKLRINNKFYEVLDNGVNYSPEALQMSFLADGMTVDTLKSELAKFDGNFDLYSDDGTTVVATYNGYTNIESIMTRYDVNLGSTTADILEFVMNKPTLQDTVNQNTADITAINEAIASLAEIVGGTAE